MKLLCVMAVYDGQSQNDYDYDYDDDFSFLTRPLVVIMKVTQTFLSMCQTWMP